MRDDKKQPERLLVKVTTPYPDFCRLPMTPGGRGEWNNCRFIVDDPTLDECDFWIVHADLAFAESARCHPENTVFIAGEPPTKFWYPPKFLAQFQNVFTYDPAAAHPRNHVGDISLPWHFGLNTKQNGHRAYAIDYDALAAMPPPEKPKLLSLVCSKKNKISEQRLRLKFIARLQKRLGSRLDVFGRGFRSIADKSDAILPYRYHIVLENSVVDHYWTEKLADAWLGWSLPIYHGCKNIDRYFDTAAMERIDIRQPESAVEAIEKVIDSSRWQDALDAVAKARERVLNLYNQFSVFARIATELHREGPRELVTLHAERAFRPGLRGLIRRLKRPGG